MQLTSMPPPSRETLTRQRIIKSGNQTIPAGQPAGSLPVTGWASDPAWPATITADALQVAGGGQATITWAHQTSGGSFRQVEAVIDGVVVAVTPQDPPAGELTWTGTVSDGARVEMRIRNTGWAAATTITAAGTWIDIIPA